MIKNITLFLLIFIQNFVFAQNQNEFLILTYEVEQNNYAYRAYKYYGVAELHKYDNMDEYKKPIIHTIFLHDFYGKDELLIDFCSNIDSEKNKTKELSSFQFPENYNEYLTNILELIKTNREVLQVINKKWNELYNEQTTIYGTVVKGNLYSCEIKDFDYPDSTTRFSFPIGDFEIIKDFFKYKNGFIKLTDFTEFDHLNLDINIRNE
jgi:hypothetical protein